VLLNTKSCSPKNQECVVGDVGYCGPGYDCQAPPGQCGTKGKCLPVPNGCPANQPPVCSCFGVTMANKCEAWAADVGISALGLCK